MIYYNLSGEGQAVVLLHGFGEDRRIWNDLASTLNKDFKVICLDLPGFGMSPRLPGQFSIDDVALTVNAFLQDDLGLSEFVVMGHSLGGYVSLSLAEQFPGSVSGFGLINSTSLADSPEKKENRLKTADFIRKHKASFFLKNFVPNLFYEQNREKLSEEVKAVIAMGKELDENLLADYMLAMMNRPERLDLLSKFQHVLFIGGEKDSGFTAKDYKIQISALKNRENGLIFQNTGHMSMFEAPAELEKVIARFLKSI